MVEKRNLVLICALFFVISSINGEDPYRFFTWKVTYGDIYPMGVKQQGILINGQFPGPQINCVTNDNLIISVYNYLNEPFLLSWNGLQHRRNSWQDGTYGTTCHQRLRHILDMGRSISSPDGLLINGRGWNGYTFQVEHGKTYRFRISNVGLTTSVNFRIQGHTMKLVEVEGSHTVQNTYTSLDLHLGQSASVLVTANQPVKDYYVVVSSRFTRRVLTTTAILHYRNSKIGVSGPPPGGPTTQIAWSLMQARSLRWNLTASGPRPNPQGSYHYGMIKPSRTIILSNSAPWINGKQRYAVNGVSFVAGDTPLKLADYFNIGGVFSIGSISDKSYNGNNAYLATSVMHADFRSFAEIVFQNWEDTVQSWHIDGYSFFVVGMDGGQWTPASRWRYNLRDTVARSTVQVYPKAWTAIYIALDNVGMWNIRSENWVRQYLGQQFYLRVYSPAHSWRDELPIPKNALLCGRARGRHTRPL
ncbi:putative L-ascorbate oxidase [Helianthus annuus]|nr:putative L-ascorbate oxidase [Helianthus annuus]